ncbi:hypothetical protein KSC_093640 [Ktedonobacter sp. SOSP1-52]|nr:hypothetical protein KSC_093640 [Ktedonobacter sp. SOSP1-52]
MLVEPKKTQLERPFVEGNDGIEAKGLHAQTFLPHPWQLAGAASFFARFQRGVDDVGLAMTIAVLTSVNPP